MRVSLRIIILAVAIAASPSVYAMLASDCLDEAKRFAMADYVVDAVVENIESRCNEREDTFTVIELKIQNYIKGNPLENDRLRLLLGSVCCQGACKRNSEEPSINSIKIGMKVKVYAVRIKDGFWLVCGSLGFIDIKSQLQED